MEKKPVVQIRNLTKVYGNKTVVDNLTFDVPRGEVFGFLGPNGAGKTTTIRMIVGLISMTQGEVLINGHDVSKDFEKAIARVGGIVENPEMYKFMSGYKNLVHFARMSPGVTKERIEEVIRLMGLENRIHDRVKTYSLGMRQRLGLAQALLHKPNLLILDEPTNGLDPAGIRELRDHLRKLAEVEGISVIVSSHLLSEMELMCDRVAIIQNGKLVSVQHLRDLMSSVNGQDGIVTVHFNVDRPAEAKKALELKFDGLSVTLHPQSIEVRVQRDLTPDLNVQLVQAGIRVFGFHTVNNTLEDKFLELTGSGQIV